MERAGSPVRKGLKGSNAASANHITYILRQGPALQRERCNGVQRRPQETLKNRCMNQRRISETT